MGKRSDRGQGALVPRRYERRTCADRSAGRVRLAERALPADAHAVPVARDPSTQASGRVRLPKERWSDLHIPYILASRTPPLAALPARGTSMKTLLVLTAGRTDVQLVVSGVRQELPSESCGELHDD